MRGKLRIFGVLLSILCLVSSHVFWGKPVAAAPYRQSSLTPVTEISGPIDLTMEVSPQVTGPRDTVTLHVRLENKQAQPASPQILISLPKSLSATRERLSPGMTFNYTDNTVNWSPILEAGGGSRELTLSFEVSVVDLTRPEQVISAQLRHGDVEQYATVSFWAGLAPTAALTISPSVAAIGQQIQLGAQIEGPGPFVQNWELGDGRHLTASEPVVAYGTPGSYEITLQVANPLGYSTATGEVTIVPNPTAALTVDDHEPVVQQSIQFSNHSGGQPPLGFTWNFGDGTTSHETDPTHQYAAPGDYHVRLMVESEYGQAEASIYLNVGLNPVVDMMVEEHTVTGKNLNAMAFTDDTVTGLFWDMGDGQSHEGEAVSHTFYRTGDFLVRLVATNSHGSTEVSKWVHVDAGTYALFFPVVLDAESDDAETAEDTASPDLQDLEVKEVSSERPSEPATSGIAEELMPEAEVAPREETDPIPMIVLPPQSPLTEDATPAEQLLWYINEARRLHNMPALSYNYQLSIAAQQHTVDMSLHQGLLHEGSDGSRPADRQQRYGYAGTYAGEAVAWGWENAIPVVEFWVNSPPHRTLILNPSAQEVGVGFTADGTAPNLWYWAAEFGIRLEPSIELQAQPH